MKNLLKDLQNANLKSVANASPRTDVAVYLERLLLTRLQSA